jgi:A/G-specific adenine glycosylase
MEGGGGAQGRDLSAVKDIGVFKKEVLKYHRRYGRHDLPWRATTDPYQILISEIMLQQTQVDRVVPYFNRWIEKFPTVQALASASLPEALKEWQGLGYNRRGKLLRECAKEITEKYGGKIPQDFATLVSLPAIGPYTAGAIRAFAFDEPGVFIETNIRAALIHHFFPRSTKVPDTKLIPLLEQLAKGEKSPRRWYSAFMDYGAFIKKMHPNPSRRSKHHTKQAKFEGSLRQVRGAILRELVTGASRSEAELKKKTGFEIACIRRAADALGMEGMIEKRGAAWRLRTS